MGTGKQDARFSWASPSGGRNFASSHVDSEHEHGRAAESGAPIHAALKRKQTNRKTQESRCKHHVRGERRQ